MGRIPVTSTSPNFPEALQLRLPACCLKPTNRPAADLPHDDRNGLLATIQKRVSVITGDRTVQKDGGRLIGRVLRLKDADVTLF
jgi:hypothetical protein